MKTAAVIRHVHFEDLGTFEEPLTRAGYEFQYYDAGVYGFPATDPATTDLLIILGEPVSVYDEDQRSISSLVEKPITEWLRANS